MTNAAAISIAATWFFIILVWDLVSDYRKNKKEKPINHDKEGQIRALLLLPSIVFLFIPVRHFNGPWWVILLLVLLIIGMVMVWYWTLFDGGCGLLRKKGFWFTGTDDPGDARSDNFLQTLPLWQHISVKLGSVLLTTTTYILFVLKNPIH